VLNLDHAKECECVFAAGSSIAAFIIINIQKRNNSMGYTTFIYKDNIVI
jgi:hypothetical protein